MSAPIGHRILTFSKLSAFQRVTGGLCSQRYLKRVKNEKQDFKPEHIKKRDPSYIDQTPGPWKNYTDLKSAKEKGVGRKKYDFDLEEVTKILQSMEINTNVDNDMPVETLPDPFKEPPKKCILCHYNVEVNYKNVQLLSQFVSPYTGRIYGRHVTGLCLHMQQRVARDIKIARTFGLMPFMNKSPEYMEDPLLYNPFQKKKYPYGE